MISITIKKSQIFNKTRTIVRTTPTHQKEVRPGAPEECVKAFVHSPNQEALLR